MTEDLIFETAGYASPKVSEPYEPPTRRSRSIVVCRGHELRLQGPFCQAHGQAQEAWMDLLPLDIKDQANQTVSKMMERYDGPASPMDGLAEEWHLGWRWHWRWGSHWPPATRSRWVLGEGVMGGGSGLKNWARLCWWWPACKR